MQTRTNAPSLLTLRRVFDFSADVKVARQRESWNYIRANSDIVGNSVRLLSVTTIRLQTSGINRENENLDFP